MADFLVTIDGKYINYGFLRGGSGPNYTLPFDYLNFDVIYDNSLGRVWCFKDYISVFGRKSGLFRGYFTYQEIYSKSFIDYNDDGKSVIVAKTNMTVDNVVPLEIHSKSFYYQDKLPKSQNDKIFLVQRKIELEGGEYILKVRIKSFNYPNEFLYNAIFFNNITDSYIEDIGKYAWGKEPYSADFSETSQNVPFELQELSTYAQRIKEKKYLAPDGSSLQDLTQKEIEIVEDISVIFDQLFRIEEFVDFLDENILRFIFNKHFEIINNEDLTPTELQSYHRDFNHKYFLGLRTRLMEFYYWAKGYFNGGLKVLAFWENPKMTVLTWIFSLFNEETLKHLSYEDKIGLLKLLVEDGLSGRWNPFRSSLKLTKEETVVKIVRSIYKTVNGQPYHHDINKFLDYLINGKFNSKDKESVFEILYDDITDAVLFGDDGTGARGQFVNAVYDLWLVSKYNPNYEEAGTNVEYTYLPLDPSKDSFYVDNLYNRSKIYLKYKGGTGNDATSSPMELDYEADKFIFWYRDNFDFDFIDSKIRAIEKKKRKTYANHGAEVNETVKRFYGFYDIFQPVTVSKIDTDEYTNETIIRLPINIDPNNSNPCDIAEGVDNRLPAFYLKYVDDLQDISNLKATLDITAEVVLTTTMIWNISKLRYLRYASNMFRIGPLTAAETLALSRACLAIFGTVDTLANFVSLGHRLKTEDCNVYNPCQGVPPQPGDPQYDAWERCKAIQKWLFAINIFTMTGSIGALRAVRSSSRKLVDVATDLSPSDINLLLQMGDKGILYNNFVNKLATNQSLFDKFDILSNEAKSMFFYDLLGQIDNNNIANLTGDIIDNWSNLRAAGALGEAKVLDLLKDSADVNRFVQYYTVPVLADEFKLVTFQQRWDFVKIMGDISPTNFGKLVDDPALVKLFMRYSDNVTTRLWFSKLDEVGKFRIVEELGDLPSELFKGFVRNPSKFNEYVNLNIAGRQLLKDNKYFWLRHDLDFNDVVKVDSELNKAKNTVIKRNVNTWFTDSNKKSRAEEFLNLGKNWNIGDVIELMSERFLKSKLNSNTEVFKSVEIKWLNIDNQIFGGRIEEIDALIYNSVTNKFDVLVSIKPNDNAHKIRRDVNKLILKMKDLPDSGQQLHDYILNVLKTSNYVNNPSSINEVVSARIIYTDIRTGNEVKILPSQFSPKITSSINTIKLHPEVFGTTKSEIVDSAYRSMVVKFSND